VADQQPSSAKPAPGAIGRSERERSFGAPSSGRRADGPPVAGSKRELARSPEPPVNSRGEGGAAEPLESGRSAAVLAGAPVARAVFSAAASFFRQMLTKTS